METRRSVPTKVLSLFLSVLMAVSVFSIALPGLATRASAADVYEALGEAFQNALDAGYLTNAEWGGIATADNGNVTVTDNTNNGVIYNVVKALDAVVAAESGSYATYNHNGKLADYLKTRLGLNVYQERFVRALLPVNGMNGDYSQFDGSDDDHRWYGTSDAMSSDVNKGSYQIIAQRDIVSAVTAGYDDPADVPDEVETSYTLTVKVGLSPMDEPNNEGKLHAKYINTSTEVSVGKDSLSDELKTQINKLKNYLTYVNKRPFSAHFSGWYNDGAINEDYLYTLSVLDLTTDQNAYYTVYSAIGTVNPNLVEQFVGREVVNNHYNYYQACISVAPHAQMKKYVDWVMASDAPPITNAAGTEVLFESRLDYSETDRASMLDARSRAYSIRTALTNYENANHGILAEKYGYDSSALEAYIAPLEKKLAIYDLQEAVIAHAWLIANDADSTYSFTKKDSIFYSESDYSPAVYARTTDTAPVEGKTYYILQDDEYTAVETPVAEDIDTYYELTSPAYYAALKGISNNEYVSSAYDRFALTTDTELPYTHLGTDDTLKPGVVYYTFSDDVYTVVANPSQANIAEYYFINKTYYTVGANGSFNLVTYPDEDDLGSYYEKVGGECPISDSDLALIKQFYDTAVELLDRCEPFNYYDAITVEDADSIRAYQVAIASEADLRGHVPADYLENYRWFIGQVASPVGGRSNDELIALADTASAKYTALNNAYNSDSNSDFRQKDQATGGVYKKFIDYTARVFKEQIYAELYDRACGISEVTEADYNSSVSFSNYYAVKADIDYQDWTIVKWVRDIINANSNNVFKAAVEYLISKDLRANDTAHRYSASRIMSESRLSTIANAVANLTYTYAAESVPAYTVSNFTREAGAYNDFARSGDVPTDDYLVETGNNKNLQNTVKSIDKFLANDNFTELLGVDEKGYNTLSDYIKSLLVENVFTDGMINTIVALLFPMLTSVFEDTLPGIIETEVNQKGLSALTDGQVGGDIYVNYNTKGGTVSFEQYTTRSNLYIYPSSFGAYMKSNTDGKRSIVSDAYAIGDWIDDGGNDWNELDLDDPVWDPVAQKLVKTFDATDIERYFKANQLSWGIDTIKRSSYPATHAGFESYCERRYEQTKDVLGVIFGSAEDVLEALLTTNNLVLHTDNGNKKLVSASAQHVSYSGIGDIALTVTSLTVDLTVYGVDLYHNLWIPVLEALGINGDLLDATCISGNKELTGSNWDIDHAVDALLDPVYDLIDEICKHPIENICKLLPNLCFHLMNRSLQKLIEAQKISINIKATDFDGTVNSTGWGGILNGLISLLHNFIVSKINFSKDIYIGDFLNLDEKLPFDITNINNLIQGILTLIVGTEDDGEGGEKPKAVLHLPAINMATLMGARTSGSNNKSTKGTRYNFVGDNRVTVNRQYLSTSTTYQYVFYLILNYVFEAAKQPGFVADVLSFIKVVGGSDIELPGIVYTILNSTGKTDDIIAAIVELFNGKTYALKDMDWYNTGSGTASYGEGELLLGAGDFVYLRYGNDWTKAKADYLYNNIDKIANDVFNMIDRSLLENYEGDASKWLDAFVNSMFNNQGIQNVIDLLVKLGFTLANNPNIAKLIRQQLKSTSGSDMGTDLLCWFNDFAYQVLDDEDFEDVYGDFFTLKTQSELGEEFVAGEGEYIKWVTDTATGYRQAFVFAREKVKNKKAEEGEDPYLPYNSSDSDTYNEVKQRAWPNCIQFTNGGAPIYDEDGKLKVNTAYANGGSGSNFKNLTRSDSALTDADGEEYFPWIIKLTADTEDYVTNYSAGQSVTFKEGMMDGNSENYPSSRAVFTACFCELIGPFVKILNLLLTGGGLKLFNALEIKGYESYNAAILPLLEALGVTELPTQKQLNEDMTAIEGFNMLVNRLFISLTDLLRDDRVYVNGVYQSGKGGFQKIVDVLPHLFYFLQSGGLANIIRNLLAFAWTLVDTIRPLVDLDLDQVIHVLLWRLLGCCYDEYKDDYRVDTVVTELFDLIGINAVPYNAVKEAADKKKVDAILGISIETLDLAELYPLVEALTGLDLRPLVYCFEGMCVYDENHSSNGVKPFTRVNSAADDNAIFSKSVYYQPSRKASNGTITGTAPHAYTLQYDGGDILTVTLSAVLDLLKYKDNAKNLDKLIGLAKESIPGGGKLIGDTSASGVLDVLELIFQDSKHSSKLDRPNWDYLLEGKEVSNGSGHTVSWSNIMGENTTSTDYDFTNWQNLVEFVGGVGNSIDMSSYHTLYNLEYTTDWTEGTAKSVVDTLENILNYVAVAMGSEEGNFNQWINDFLDEKVFNSDILYTLVSYLAKAYDIIPEGIRSIIDNLFEVNMSGWERDGIVIKLTPESIQQIYNSRNEISKIKYTVTTFKLAENWQEGRIYYTEAGDGYEKVGETGTITQAQFVPNTYYYKDIKVNEEDRYDVRIVDESHIEVDTYVYGYADDQYVDNDPEKDLIEGAVQTYHISETTVYVKSALDEWYEDTDDRFPAVYSANNQHPWFTADSGTYVHDRQTFLAALKAIVHSADKLFGYIFLEDDYRILYTAAEDLEQNENSSNHADDQYDDVTDAITINGVGLYGMLVIPVLEALGVPLTTENYNKLVETAPDMAQYYANAYTGENEGEDYDPDKYYQPLFIKEIAGQDPVTSFTQEDGFVPYIKNGQRVKGYNTAEWIDDMFVIFEDFFNAVLADPLNWALDILPGLIYFINSSGLTTAIRNTLGAVQDLIVMINNILSLSDVDERIGMVIGDIDLTNTTLAGLLGIVVKLLNKDKEDDPDAPKFHFSDELMQVCRDMFIGKLTAFTSANGYRSFTMSYNETVQVDGYGNEIPGTRQGEGKRDMVTILVALAIELLTDKGTFVDAANGYRISEYDNAAALGNMIGADYRDLISEVIGLLRNPGDLAVSYKDINWDYFKEDLNLAAREENTGKEVNIEVPRFAFQYLNYTTAWKYESAVTTVDGMEGLIMAVLGMVDEKYEGMTKLSDIPELDISKFFTAETAQFLLDVISNLLYGKKSIISSLAGIIGAVLGADLTEWDYTYQFVSPDAVPEGKTPVDDPNDHTPLKCYKDYLRKQTYVAYTGSYDETQSYFNHIVTYVPVEIGEFAAGATYYEKNGSDYSVVTGEFDPAKVYYTRTEKYEEVNFEDEDDFIEKSADMDLAVSTYETTEKEVATYVIDCSESKDDFANAIALILRPAGQLLAWLLFDDPYEFFVGNTEATQDDILLTIPGANGYEKGLVLLLEALGLKGLGYASRYTSDENGNDLFLQDLSKSIVARMDEILANPVGELVGLIPELIYFINANGLAAVVNNLLAGPLALVGKVPSALALVSDSDFDLGTLFTKVAEGEEFDPNKQYYTLEEGKYIAREALTAFAADVEYYYLDATRVINTLVTGLLDNALSDRLDLNDNGEVDPAESVNFDMDKVNLGWIVKLAEKITGLEIDDLLANTLDNFYIGKIKSYASMSRSVAYKMEFDDRGFKNGGNGDRGDFLTILLSFAIDLICYEGNAEAIAKLINNEKITPELLASIVRFIHGEFTVDYNDYDWFYFDEDLTLYEMVDGKIRRKTRLVDGEEQPTPYSFDYDTVVHAPLNSFNYLTYQSDWTEETAKYLTDHRNEILGAVLKMVTKSDKTPAELLKDLFDPTEKIYTASVLNSIIEPIKSLVDKINPTLLDILGIVLDIDLSAYNDLVILYDEVTYTKEAISRFEDGVQYFTATYTAVGDDAEFDEDETYYTKDDEDKYVVAKDLEKFAEDTVYYTVSYDLVPADAEYSADETYYIKHEINYQKGNRDVFVSKLTEMLLPLSPILDWLLFGKDLEYFDKKVENTNVAAPGTEEEVEVLIKLKGSLGYEKGLIPLLEALGVTLPNVTDDDNTASILPVLVNNVLARVEAIFANPVDEVLNLLPELLYFINANGLATSVHNLLAGVFSLVEEVAKTGALSSLLGLPADETVDISSVVSDLLADLGVKIDIEKLDLVAILTIVRDLTKVEDATYAVTNDETLDEEKTYYTKDGDEYKKVEEPKQDEITTYYEKTVNGTSKGIDLIDFCTENKIDRFYFGEMYGYPSASGQIGFKMRLTEEQGLHDLLTFIVNLALEFLMDESNADAIDALINGVEMVENSETGENELQPKAHTVGAIVKILKGLKELDNVEPTKIDWDYFLVTGELASTGITMPESQFVYLDYSNLWTRDLATGLGGQLTDLINEILALTAEEGEEPKTLADIMSGLVNLDGMLNADLLNQILDGVSSFLYGDDSILATELLNLIGLVLGADLTEWEDNYRFEAYDAAKTYTEDAVTGLQYRTEPTTKYVKATITEFADGVTYYTADEVAEGAVQTYTVAATYVEGTTYYTQKNFELTIYAIANANEFASGLALLLQPAQKLLGWLLLGNDYRFFVEKANGNVKATATDPETGNVVTIRDDKELLVIPGFDGYDMSLTLLLEALGCTLRDEDNNKIPLKKASEYEGNEAELLKDVITSLIGRVNEILADPIDQILDLIPELIYFVNAGGLNAVVMNLAGGLLSVIDYINESGLITDDEGNPKPLSVEINGSDVTISSEILNVLITNLLNDTAAIKNLLDKDNDGELSETEKITFRLDTINIDWIIDLAEKLTGLAIHDAVGSTYALSKLMFGSVERYDSASNAYNRIDIVDGEEVDSGVSLTYRVSTDEEEKIKNRGDVITIVLSLVLDTLKYDNNPAVVAGLLSDVADGKITEDVIRSAIAILEGGWEVQYATPEWFYWTTTPETLTSDITSNPETMLVDRTINYLTYGSEWTDQSVTNLWNEETAQYVVENIDAIISDVMKIMGQEGTTVAELLKGVFDPAEQLYTAEVLNKIVGLVKQLSEKLGDSIVNIFGLVLGIHLDEYDEMTFTDEQITDKASFINGLVTALKPIYTVLDWLLFGKDLAFLYDNEYYNQGFTKAEGITEFEPNRTYYTLSYTEVPAGAAFNPNAEYYTKDGENFVAADITAFAEGVTYYAATYTKATAYAAGTTYYTDLGGSLINILGGMGYANAIVPLFEALGITMPNATEMDDEELTTVLTAVFNKLDTILADPVNEVLDLLPNLIYFINANGLSVVVGNLVASLFGLVDAAAPIIVKFVGDTITLSEGDTDAEDDDIVLVLTKTVTDEETGEPTKVILPTKDILNNLINGLLRSNGIAVKDDEGHDLDIDYQAIDLLTGIRIAEAATGMKIIEVVTANKIDHFYIGKLEYKPYADGRDAFFMSYRTETEEGSTFEKEERHDMLTILVNLIAEVLLYQKNEEYVNVNALCALVPQLNDSKDMILEVIELLTNPKDYTYSEINWNYFNEDAVLGDEIAVPKSDFIYLAYKNNWTFTKATEFDAGLVTLVDKIIKMVKEDPSATLADLIAGLVDIDALIAKPEYLNSILDLLKKYLYGDEAVLGQSLLDLIGLMFNAELSEWNDVYAFEPFDETKHTTEDPETGLYYQIREVEVEDGDNYTKQFYGIATLDDFINGLCKILSPASDLLSFLLLGDSYGFFTDNATGHEILIQVNGAKGYANGLALLLEALGVKDLQPTYANGNALLKDVLTKLVARVHEILENPIDEVLALLTELIYFINANGLSVVVKNLAGAAFNIIDALNEAHIEVNLDVDGLINGLITDALGEDVGFTLDGVNIQWVINVIEKALKAKLDVEIHINAVLDASMYSDYPLERLAIGKAVPYDSVTDRYFKVPADAEFDATKTYYTKTADGFAAAEIDAFAADTEYYTKSANNYKMIFGDGTENGGASRADMITILLSFVIDMLRDPYNQTAIESIEKEDGTPLLKAGTIAAILEVISEYTIEIDPKTADWFYFSDPPYNYTNGADLTMFKPTINYLSYASDWTEKLADYLDDNLNAIINKVFEIIDKDKDDADKLVSVANILKGVFDPQKDIYTADNLNKIALAIANLTKGLQDFILDTVKLLLDIDLGYYKVICEYDEAEGEFTSCTHFVGDAEGKMPKESFVAGLRELLEPIFPVLDWLLFGKSFKFFNKIMARTDGQPDVVEDLVVINGYEGYAYGLVPILEAILLPVGVTLPDCSDPTADTYDTEHMIGAVLSDVLFGLEKILADPVENALAIIPNLLYFINANGLGTAVNHLLGAVLALLDKALPIITSFDVETIDISEDISIVLTNADHEILPVETILNNLINGLLSDNGITLKDDEGNVKALNIKDIRLIDVAMVGEALIYKLKEVTIELTEFIEANHIENFYVGQITLNRAENDENRAENEVYRSNGRGDAISFRMEYADDRDGESTKEKSRADLITVLVNYLLEAVMYGENAKNIDILISGKNDEGLPNSATVESILSMIRALGNDALPGDYHWNYFNEEGDNFNFTSATAYNADQTYYIQTVENEYVVADVADEEAFAAGTFFVPITKFTSIDTPVTPFNNHLKYTTDWTQTTANTIYDNLDDVITAILTIIAKGDANKATTVAELLNGQFNLFSAEIVNKIADLIQQLYDNFDASLVNLIGTVLGCDISSWQGMHFEASEVYDAETFKAALYQIISPISRVLDWLLFGETYGFFVEDKNSGYDGGEATTLINVGGAEGYLYGLAPILVALGIDPDALPAYTEDTTCMTMVGDKTFLKAVLDVLVDRVAAVLADPVDEALAMLPELLYFINANGVSTAAYNLAGGVLNAINVLFQEGIISLKAKVKDEETGEETEVVCDSIEEYLAKSIGLDIRNLDLEGIIDFLEKKDYVKGIKINEVFKGTYEVDANGNATFTYDSASDNNILEKFYCGTVESYSYGDFSGWKMVAADGKQGDIITMLLSILLDVLYYEGNEQAIADLINELWTDVEFTKDNFIALKMILQNGAEFNSEFNPNWAYFVKNVDEWVAMAAEDQVALINELVAGLPEMKGRTQHYLEYDNNWNEAVVTYLDNNINDIVDLVINMVTKGDYPDLEKLIKSKLNIYSADTVNWIVEKLAGLLAKLDEVLTKELQDKLITTAGSLLGLTPDVLERATTPAEDGSITNKQEFVDALVYRFGGLNRVLDWLLFNKSYTFFTDLDDGADAMIVINGGEGYKYGLAPILAALGVDTNITATSCADGALSEVLGKVADRIDELLYGGNGKKTLNEVLALLPELIYFINTGAVSEAIMNLLQPADELLKVVNENLGDGAVLGKDSVADFFSFTFNGTEYRLYDTNPAVKNYNTIDFDFIFDIVKDKIGIDIANSTGTSADGVELGKVGDYIKTFYFGQLESNDSYGDVKGYKMNYSAEDTRMDMLTILVTLVLDVFTSGTNEDAIVELLGGDADAQNMYSVIYSFLTGDLIEVQYQKFDWMFEEYADTGIIVSPMTEDGTIVNQSIYGPLYTRAMGEYMTKYLQLAINTYITLLGVKVNGKAVFTLDDILQELVGSNIYKNEYLQSIYNALLNLLTGLKYDTLGEELYNHIAEILDSALGVNLNYWFGTTEEAYTGPDEIEEGDQEAFIAEICKMLRPAYPVLRWLLAEDKIALFNKAAGADQDTTATVEPIDDNDYLVLNGAAGYKYGIIPILEALCNGDTTNIKSYSEYLADDEADPTGDALLKDILTPILCKVDDILADPINGVLNLLPAVVYFVGSNGLDTCFKNILGSVYTLLFNIDPLIANVEKLHDEDGTVSLYPLIGIDLRAINLETLLRQLLDSLKDSTGFALSDLGIELFNELAMGVIESYYSYINEDTFFQDMYTMKYATEGTDVEGNKCDTVDFVTIILRLVLTFISDPDNVKQVEAMLKDKVSEDGYTLLCSLLDNFSQMVRTADGKDKMMYTVYYVFYSALCAGVATNNAFAEFNGNYSFLYNLFTTSDLAFMRSIGSSLSSIFHMTDDNGNEVVSPIIDETGVVPQGQIPFWQKIIEFFKQIINFFKNMFK